MKFKDLFSVTRNKNNKQYNFSLKIKEARKLGLTPEQILKKMNSIIPKVSPLGDMKKQKQK